MQNAKKIFTFSALFCGEISSHGFAASDNIILHHA
jgi:hypothetical protein